jgi:hypothetical protein
MQTVILRVVLYGCEAWSFAMKEGHRLRVYENRVVGMLGQLRNEALDNL